MKPSISLKWSCEPLGDALRRHLSGLNAADIELYIETLDGTPDPQQTAWVLSEYGIRTHGDSMVLVDGVDALGIDYDDERIFPCYDTLWILERGDFERRAAPFVTWYAAESESSFPKAANGGQDLSDWSLVEQWCEAQGALFGISCGHRTLTITCSRQR